MDRLLAFRRTIYFAVVLLLVMSTGAFSQAEEAGLVAALQDPLWSIRMDAANALGAMEELAADTLDHLGQALTEDAIADVREAAAYALAGRGEAAAPVVPHLIAALRDPDGAVRLAAAVALEGVGAPAKPAVSAMMRVIPGEEGPARAALLRALGSAAEGTEEQKLFVHQLLNDDDAEVRQAAVAILGAWAADSDEILERLAPMMYDEVYEVRQEVAAALQQIGPAVVPYLIELIWEREAPPVSPPDDAWDFSGDFADVGIYFSGYPSPVPWLLDTSTFSAGTRSARSAAIGDNQSTGMNLDVTVTEPSLLLFDFKVSSEAYYDELVFEQNGQYVDSFSGEVDWMTYEQRIEPGSYTFTWTYTKDSSVSDGADAAWIDNLRVVPLP